MLRAASTQSSARAFSRSTASVRGPEGRRGRAGGVGDQPLERAPAAAAALLEPDLPRHRQAAVGDPARDERHLLLVDHPRRALQRQPAGTAYELGLDLDRGRRRRRVTGVRRAHDVVVTDGCHPQRAPARPVTSVTTAANGCHTPPTRRSRSTEAPATGTPVGSVSSTPTGASSSERARPTSTTRPVDARATAPGPRRRHDAGTGQQGREQRGDEGGAWRTGASTVGDGHRASRPVSRSAEADQTPRRCPSRRRAASRRRGRAARAPRAGGRRDRGCSGSREPSSTLPASPRSRSRGSRSAGKTPPISEKKSVKAIVVSSATRSCRSASVEELGVLRRAQRARSPAAAAGAARAGRRPAPGPV